MQASAELLGVEHQVEALLDPFDHCVLEVGGRDPWRVAERYAARDIAAAEVVRRHPAARKALGLKVLAAVSALDESGEQVWAMPRPANAEPPHAVASLGGVPDLAGNNGGRGPFDDHVFGSRDPELAALLADVAIACLTVAERARVY